MIDYQQNPYASANHVAVTVSQVDDKKNKGYGPRRESLHIFNTGKANCKSVAFIDSSATDEPRNEKLDDSKQCHDFQSKS
jgi:hypothetical protein